MLPTPGLAREMAQLIRDYDVDTVWFGAAAPLAVLAPAARKAGARKIVASTHGHEVGWSMVPGARQILRFIGNRVDVLTYVSEYAKGRFERAFGPHPRWLHLPGGVDTDFFAPVDASVRDAVRQRYGVGEGPLIVSFSRLVARKGHDTLIAAMPAIAERLPGARLIIAGEGPYRATLARLIDGMEPPTTPESARLVGRVPDSELRDLVASADVVAVPVRTRGKGMDVEGLGIVFLEAQSCAVPVIAGNSGGAPEAVGPGAGVVIDGRSVEQVADALIDVLTVASKRRAMGRAGREFVAAHYSWERLGPRVGELLHPGQ